MTTPPRRPASDFNNLAIRRPNSLQITDFRGRHAEEVWSYPDVGATRGVLPEGWDHEEMTFDVGSAAVFPEACKALDSWVMFDLPWVRMHRESTQQVGSLVTFDSALYGLWMLHACRVAYRTDDATTHGFAYGTLFGHAVRGEERFWVAVVDGRTLYAIRKFSRLHHPMARLARPLATRFQKRFTRQSGRRMIDHLAPLDTALDERHPGPG